MIIDEDGVSLSDVLCFLGEKAKELDVRPGHYMHFDDIADMIDGLAREHQMNFSYLSKQLREYTD